MSSKFTLETKPISDPARLDRNVRSEMPDGGSPAPERGRGCHRSVDNLCTHQIQRRVPASTSATRATRLSASEERALAKRIKMGDTAAKKQLITANLALVLRAVDGYKRSGIPRDDLVQEGNLGLIRAAQSFDPSAHNARFATYARFWIQASLVRALASNGSLIQLPERSHLLRNRYRRALGELRSRVPVGSDVPSLRPPSLDEIARHMGVSSRRLKWAGLTQNDRTLCLPLGELVMADGPSPDQDVANEEDRALVYAALRRLSPFEAWVIRERYGLGEPSPGQGARSDSRRRTDGRHSAGRAPASGFPGAAPAHAPRSRQSYYQRSYTEIGSDCGLSVHRVRQVEKTVLEKLRGLLALQLAKAR
jgi:RNA polymerase primary sigma factor